MVLRGHHCKMAAAYPACGLYVACLFTDVTSVLSVPVRWSCIGREEAEGSDDLLEAIQLRVLLTLHF